MVTVGRSFSFKLNEFSRDCRPSRASIGYQWSRAASKRAAEKGGGAPHLVLGVEILEIEHRRDAVDTRPLAGGL
jgi:hypothetical protein